MSKWIGYAVSVNCGEPLGCYQGTILEADGTTITLTKAFRNGFPYPKSQVTLNAADIKELRIIEEAAPERVEQTHSTVAVSKAGKKVQRATVCENLQATNTSSAGTVQHAGGGGGGGGGAKTARSKPIDIQGPRAAKNNTHSGSNSGSTPKARGAVGGGGGAGVLSGAELARRRNEACFGDAAEPALLDDFDFEGNLALFDKQALWQQMRAAARPDVVRAADEAARCFRHDENVLPAAPGHGGHGAGTAGIRVPEELRAGVDLVTDDGRRVPAVNEAARRLIWDRIVSRGGAVCAAAYVLLARAAADVGLRLVGGGRRLDARNAHQAPAAAVLAARHRAGAAAVCAARLLASHAVRAHLLLVGDAIHGEEEAVVVREVEAFTASGGALVSRVGQLPPAPDLLLLALHDPRHPCDDQQEQQQFGAVLSWARGVRGAVVWVEPRARGGAGCAGRAAVLGALPAALPPALGQQFLADVAPPPTLFADLGIAYFPPFGASSVVALH